MEDMTIALKPDPSKHGVETEQASTQLQFTRMRLLQGLDNPDVFELRSHGFGRIFELHFPLFPECTQFPKWGKTSCGADWL